MSRLGFEPPTSCSGGGHLGQELILLILLILIMCIEGLRNTRIHLMVLHKYGSGHRMIAIRSPLIRNLQVVSPLNNKALASRSPLNYQALASGSPRTIRHLHCACFNHVGVTSKERLDQGHLHPNRAPGRGLNLRPPAPQTGTLAKSYCDSLHI